LIVGKPTTFWAPVHRVLQRWGNPSNGGVPVDAAPSMDFLGSGVQDHRLPYNSKGQTANQPGCVGWYGAGMPMVVDLVPSAANVANIAAAQAAASGTAMTLVAASGSGVVVLSAAAPASFQPSGTVATAGVCIENLPALKSFGVNGGSSNTSFYDRASYVGRAISVTANAGASGGAILFKGYDVYGYPMSESITAVAGSTVNGKKAWKVITSATPQFTDAGHTYSVGTADIFGIGLLSTNWGCIDVTWNNQSITANTGYTVADQTSPATSTTGDVRGTYAVQSASDGTKRLTIYASPSLTGITSNPTTGLFGQPQA
jgi:hypothetical protein